MKIVLFTLLLGIASIHAAIIDACVDNTVLLGCQGPPQLIPSQYRIDLSDFDVCPGKANVFCYTPGRTYHVALYHPENDFFKGFLVQSKLVSNRNILVGDFSDYGLLSRLHTCGPISGGITHVEPIDKRIVRWKWTAPLEGTGPVQFFTTVVKNAATYWVEQPSPVIIEKTSLVGDIGRVPLVGTRYPFLDRIVEGVTPGMVSNFPYRHSFTGMLDNYYTNNYWSPSIFGLLDNQCPATTLVINGVPEGMMKQCPFFRAMMGVDDSTVLGAYNDIYSRNSILSPNMLYEHEQLKHIQNGITVSPFSTRTPFWNTLDAVTPNFPWWSSFYWPHSIIKNPMWQSRLMTNPITPFGYYYNSPYYLNYYNKDNLFYNYPFLGMSGLHDYMRMRMDPKINLY